MIRVFDQQTFCLRNGEQTVIGADKRKRRFAGLDQLLISQANRCQMYSVIGSQWMLSR